MSRPGAARLLRAGRNRDGSSVAGDVDRVASRIRRAEEAFARAHLAQQQRWHYRLERGRVWFDSEIRRAHRRFKQRIPAFIAEGSVLNLLTVPITYSLIVPLLLLDLSVTLYQRICFPVYGIAVVRRRAYLVVDRHKLAYLNNIERLHCTYCSYATGLLAYAREITARTEQYWCPIKHARAVRAPHGRYHAFVDFGDAEGYRQDLSELRRALRTERCTSAPPVIPVRADRHGEAARQRERRPRRPR